MEINQQAPSLQDASTGKIFSAQHQGRYLIKFKGDIRLTLSSTLEKYVATMLGDDLFISASIDLTSAQGLDSTCLGVLAKLGIQAEQEYGMRLLLFSTNPDITLVLHRMGLDEVFDIRECASNVSVCDQLLSELSYKEKDLVEGKESMRQRIIQAHRVLMSLNEENQLAFSELVETLENNQ